MKKWMTLAASALIALSATACGTIKAVDPQPVPLTGAHFGKMALDDTAMPDTLNICGQQILEFKTSLQNGFNYITTPAQVTVTSPEDATATLILESLQTNCVSDKFVDGNIITIQFKFSWKFKDGSVATHTAVVPGAAEGSVKAALTNAVENMYNFALSTHLSKLDLASNTHNQ